MAQRTIRLDRHLATQAQLRFNIYRLRQSREYRRGLTRLPITKGQEIPGIVHRTFRFRSGATKEVKLHARVMVAFMRALLRDPGLEVTADASSPYSGSFRTWEQQAALYADYRNGNGHKAAEPGHGYHQTGRALDMVNGGTPRVNDAMLAVRDGGDRFFSGAAFGDPPHYSFGELG